jgi:tetrahydromethanopterin S-methyltransferase subunit G
MTVEELAREVRSLKHRLDLAETRPSQIEGRFEFVSGQLRDIQLYQHSKFAEIDNRLDGVEGRLERVEGRLEKSKDVSRGSKGVSRGSKGVSIASRRA